MIKELESFFYSMKVGEKVTNSLLVEFLEMKGLKIENTIKTDVVLEIVKEISKKGIIKKEKENSSNKWSRWIYVKV